MGANESNVNIQEEELHLIDPMADFPSLFKKSAEAYYSLAETEKIDKIVNRNLDFDQDYSFIIDLFCHYQWLTNEPTQLEAMKNVIIPLFCKLQHKYENLLISKEQKNFETEMFISKSFLKHFVPLKFNQNNFIQKKVTAPVSDIYFNVREFITENSKKGPSIIFNSQPFNYAISEKIRSFVLRHGSKFTIAALFYSIEHGDVASVFLSLANLYDKGFEFPLYPSINIKSLNFNTAYYSSQNIIGRFKLQMNFESCGNKANFSVVANKVWISKSKDELLFVDLSPHIAQTSKRVGTVSISHYGFECPPAMCHINGSILLSTGKTAVLYNPKDYSTIKIFEKHPDIKMPLTSDGKRIYSLQSPSEVWVSKVKKTIEVERKIILTPPLSIEAYNKASIVTNGIFIQFIELSPKNNDIYSHNIYTYLTFNGKLVNKCSSILDQRIDVANFDAISRTLWTFACNHDRCIISRFAYNGPDSPGATGHNIDYQKVLSEKDSSKPLQELFVNVIKAIDFHIIPYLGSGENSNDKLKFLGGGSKIVKAIKFVNESEASHETKAIFMRSSMAVLARMGELNAFLPEDVHKVCQFLTSINDDHLAKNVIYTACKVLPALRDLNSSEVTNIFTSIYSKFPQIYRVYMRSALSRSDTLFKAIPTNKVQEIINNFGTIGNDWKGLIRTYIRVLFKALSKSNNPEILQMAIDISNIMMDSLTRNASFLSDPKSDFSFFFSKFLNYSKIGIQNVEFAKSYLPMLSKGVNTVLSFNISTPILATFFSTIYIGLREISQLEVDNSLAMNATDFVPIKKEDIIESTMTIEEVYKINTNPRIAMFNKKSVTKEIELSIYLAIANILNMDLKPTGEEKNSPHWNVVSVVYSIRDQLRLSRQETNKFDPMVETRQPKMIEQYDNYLMMIRSKVNFLAKNRSKMEYNKDNLNLIKSFILSEEPIETMLLMIEDAKSKKEALKIGFESLSSLLGSYSSVVPFVEWLIEENIFQHIIDSLESIGFLTLEKIKDLYGKIKYSKFNELPSIFALKSYLVVKALEMGNPECKDFVSQFFSEYIIKNDRREFVTSEKLIACCIQNLYIVKFGADPKMIKAEQGNWINDETSIIQDAALILAGHSPQTRLDLRVLFLNLSSLHESMICARESIRIRNPESTKKKLSKLIVSIGSIILNEPSKFFKKLKENHDKVLLETAELLRLLLADSNNQIIQDLFKEILGQFGPTDDSKKLKQIVGVLFVLSNTVEVKTDHQLRHSQGKTVVEVGDICTSLPITAESEEQTIDESSSYSPLLPFTGSLYEPNEELINVFTEALQNKDLDKCPILKFYALKVLQEYVRDPITCEKVVTKIMEKVQINIEEFAFSESTNKFVDLIRYGISEEQKYFIKQNESQNESIMYRINSGKDFEDEFIDNEDMMMPDGFTIIPMGDGAQIYVSKLISKTDITSFKFMKPKKFVAVAGVLIHSPDVNMTSTVYYTSDQSAIFANRLHIVDIDRSEKFVEFVYNNQIGDINIWTDNGMTGRFKIPDGDASFFAIKGPNTNFKYKITETKAETHNKKTLRYSKHLGSMKGTFFQIQKIVADETDELPAIISPSYSGSMPPLEIENIGVLPVIHYSNYKGMPSDIILSNAAEIIIMVYDETITQMISASFRYNLNDSLSRFSITSEMAVRFIMCVSLMLENFHLHKGMNSCSFPLDLRQTIFDDGFVCRDSSMVEQLDSARILYNYLIRNNPDDLIKNLTSQMDEMFKNPEMHFVMKSNSRSKVLTGVGKVELKPSSIIMVGDFNNSKVYSLRSDVNMKYYSYDVSGTINVTEEKDIILALETDPKSNNFAFGSFLELAVYWKYSVFLTDKLSTEISDAVQRSASKLIIRSLWWSIIAMSPFFIVHATQLINLIGSRISIGTECKQLLEDIISKANNLPKQLQNNIIKQSKTYEMEAFRKLRDFYPEISGKTEIPDGSDFELPPSSLGHQFNNDLVARVLKPVSTIKGFPVHLILYDWVHAFIENPPVFISKGETDKTLSITFETFIPKEVIFNIEPKSVSSDNTKCTRVSQSKFKVEGRNLIAEFDSDVNPDDLIISTNETIKDFEKYIRESFTKKDFKMSDHIESLQSDLKKWISFTPKEDTRIIESKKSDLMKMKYPLHLLILRQKYLFSFNSANPRATDDLGEMVRFIHIRQLQTQLLGLISKRCLSDELFTVTIERERVTKFHEGSSGDLNNTALGQFASQYHTPKQVHYYEVPYLIRFEGEDGIDSGGLTNEFTSMVTKDISSPRVRMFTITPNARKKCGNNQDKIIPVPCHGDENRHLFEALGCIIGSLIRKKLSQPFNFPHFFWRYLAGGAILRSDIFDIDEGFQSYIQQIEAAITGMTDEGFDAKLGLENTVRNSVGEECVLGGVRQKVKRGTARKYVAAAVKFRIDELVKPLEWIRRGLWDSLNMDCPSFVTPWLLESLVSADRTISIVDLEKLIVCNTDPKYSDWLRKILETYDNERRSRFLEFCTGLTTLPINAEPLKIQINTDQPITYAPLVQTCFNTIIIPPYPSCEQFKRLLDIALDNCDNNFQLA